MTYQRKGPRKRADIRNSIKQDMKTFQEVGNETLLRNLRRVMPRADLPEVKYVPANPAHVWWPLQNKWAAAIDDALRKRGLPPAAMDADPEECLRQLLNP